MRTLLRAALLCLAAWIAPTVLGLAEPLDAQTPKHNCSFCHNLHGGSYSALSDYAVAEDLCISCHGDAGPAQVDRDGTLVDIPRQQGVHSGPKHAVGDTTSCWDCHDHEGTAGLNLFMIPEVRTLPGGGTANITFTNNQAQADFTGTEGVCYGCHTDIGTQANGLNGHNGPDVCTNCHSHDGGFQGVGGACTSCHDTQRGNHRPIVQEFDRASHHIQLGGAGSEIPEADCLICHDQTTITNLSTADTTAHPRAGSDHVVLINQDSGAPIPYEKGVDPTSTLTPFCLSCHDGDGATIQAVATAPFSDAVTRPEVDVVAWNASSHAAGNECADCHEGHGSEKVTLLAPGDVSPDPTTKVEEEEGFCFTCHWSGGGAPDLEAGWSTPTFWQDDFTQNGALNNDRHDIAHADQGLSGAKIECVNCHDPHTASATGGPLSKLRADPDPSDGRVPGSNWFEAQAGAGQAADPVSEWCMDCHDNSFPSTVVAPTLPLDDIRSSWIASAQHGAQSGGSPVTGAAGWNAAGNGILVPCLACHQPHPEDSQQQTNAAAYNNLFQLRDNPLDFDMVTPLVSAEGSPFEITSLTTRRDDTVQGYFWCNTCHSGSMGSGKLTCFSCHTHGDGRF